jgi:hypothetical protein
MPAARIHQLTTYKWARFSHQNKPKTAGRRASGPRSEHHPEPPTGTQRAWAGWEFISLEDG